MGLTSVLILDGGLGTSLEDKYNVRLDSSAPLWSSHLLITDPQTLIRCQRDFARVPVDILLTPTYQVSVEGFARTVTPANPTGIPRAAVGEYLETALRVSEEAASEGTTQLALSLGPYGASMIPGQEYSGAYDTGHSTEDQLFEWHLDRLRLFLQLERLTSRVAYIAFETVPRVDEIRAIRRAVEASGLLAQNQSLKVWISCVFPGEAMTLPDGNDISHVVAAMMDSGVAAFVPWGIGINCTKIHKLRDLIDAYEDSIKGHPATEANLVLYPDGTNGEVYNTTTYKWEAPEGITRPQRSWESQLAETVEEACRRGRWASIIVGGCCKTTSEDLRRLRRLLVPEKK